MDPHVGQWLDLAVRWLHVIAGIAWVGTSFYFNWLNSRLAPLERPEPGVDGELWSVHGGGFYRTVKYTVAPERLPRALHWFKWEAYVTWLSGFALLVLIYYLGAASYLIDARVADISPALGISVGIASLGAGWLVYDLLCRSTLARQTVAFSALGLGLVAAVAWGLSQLLSARAAYIHVGALLGTLMAGNVFRVIIPSQRAMVQAMEAGRAPDAALGRQAALRSLHNNYLTLPVVFIMVSNHYPMTYGHPWSWGILTGLALIGAATRHYFNLRHRGRRNPWIVPAAALAMIGLALVTAPRNGEPPAGPGTVPFAEVRAVIARRCTSCHSESPTDPRYPVAPAAVALDTPTQIRAQAQRIYAVTVASQTMPLGNATAMTDEERELLGRWVRQGAPLR